MFVKADGIKSMTVEWGFEENLKYLNGDLRYIALYVNGELG